uniref:U3 small nucleolar RNA-associated protein 12 n=1 Tax=Piliocolobus tephrosceles TaxID=591936 RepID=A0A8C9HG32_9PRIM
MTMITMTMITMTMITMTMITMTMITMTITMTMITMTMITMTMITMTMITMTVITVTVITMTVVVRKKKKNISKEKVKGEGESKDKIEDLGEDIANSNNTGKNDTIIEKKIYDYSKCFKEICEINKGHNMSVVFLNLSQNNDLLLSICKKYVKIWNIHNLENIITISIEKCTSGFFCYNDEYIILGDEFGYIFLYDLKNIELKYSYKAHAMKIVSMCPCPGPNRTSFLSVGEEKFLKLFNFTMEVDSSDDENGSGGEDVKIKRASVRNGIIKQNKKNVLTDKKTDRINKSNNINKKRKVSSNDFVVKDDIRKSGKKNGTTSSSSSSSSSNIKSWVLRKEELNSDEYDSNTNTGNNYNINVNKELKLKFKEIEYYEVTDKVSCAIYSPNGKYICIGYLNNLIEVLYSDTLKTHLTLYGHSLPITCIDVSSDNLILASSSSDKNLFIWNLEFGNINKRLYINCDVLTKIQFFNKNNNLISLSRDGYIKMWDAIKFQCICTMDGNFGILTSIVIHKEDSFFITSGSHKSIRYWVKVDDLIFLEEEREKELTLQIEKEALRNDITYPSALEKNALLTKATIKTIESIKSAEKLIEYLDIVEEEITVLETYYKNKTAYEEAKIKKELPDFVQPPNKPTSRPELLNKDPYEFIINIICSIKNNILYEVLISLPFYYAYKLLNYIKMYLTSFFFLQSIQTNRKKYQTCGNFSFQVEYCINIVLSIISIYRNQFLFDHKFRFYLYELHQLIIPNLQRCADICSFNQITLNFFTHALEDEADDNLLISDNVDHNTVKEEAT